MCQYVTDFCSIDYTGITYLSTQYIKGAIVLYA